MYLVFASWCRAIVAIDLSVYLRLISAIAISSIYLMLCMLRMEIARIVLNKDKYLQFYRSRGVRNYIFAFQNVQMVIVTILAT